MLVGGEKFRMSWTRVGGFGGDGDGGIDIEGDRREANFVAASLVAELERDVLGAERSIGSDDERDAEDDLVLIYIERRFRERESFQLAMRIEDFTSGFETGGQVEAKIGGDEIFRGRLASVDVKTVANLEDDGELEGAGASDGLDGDIDGRRDDFAAGRYLRVRGGKRDQNDQKKSRGTDGGSKLHKRTCWPSC
jgi:hypothetical protein